MSGKTNLKRKLTEDIANDDQSDEELCFSDDEGTFVDGIRIPPPTKPACTFDPTGPRLIITKIVNNFFKSYANEIVLGPFHKCFNAIVGPNGSGKSNVIDSMLFVFGYRATKIRSKKVSVLLHNSEKYRDVQSATVSVHFAEIIDKTGDEYELVPNSEFVVSRTAGKDNSSYYQLNGRKVQFKEVGALLKKHGIDLDHNRFLILQGEVEQIAMMKCKGESEHESGMLEYLEDIIGTTRYKKPLVQVHERVEFLAGRRLEKLNRLQLVEKELNELKAPMEEAVGFLKTENTIVTNKNFLYQKNILALALKLAKIEEEKKEVEEVQKGFMERLKLIQGEKKEKEEISQTESKRRDSLIKRKDNLEDAFNKANNKDIQYREEMTQMNKNRKKKKEIIGEEKKKLEKLANVPEKSLTTIRECEEKIEQLKVNKEKYDKMKLQQLSQISTETKALQEKKAELLKDLAVLKKSADETKSAFTLAESELNLYVSGEEKERKNLEELKSRYEKTQTIMKETKNKIDMLKNKIPATENSLKAANQELYDVKQEEAKVSGEINMKRAQLEERRSSMMASRSQGKVLDSLMKQKCDGNCPGIYGRLGDLGAIDKKFDVAISTACGPLDNIVVDTVDTAQWCIEYLKRYDLGRATFIVLEKQEHLRQVANTPIRTPENVPRLFDLIQINDEDVRTAFYYALRDTLVAENLDQASRIAYGAQRFRVVSLGGDLIETTGTMSGGGKSVSKGRMGQSVKVTNVDPRELENMEDVINRLEGRVRELRQKQNSLDGQINTLAPELKQMKYDYEKCTRDLQGLQGEYSQIKDLLKEQEVKTRTTKADPVQVKKLTKVMEEKKTLFEAAAETADALQVEVDKICEELNEKTRGKMKTTEKNIKEAVVAMDKCKSEILRLQGAVRTAERDTKKTTEKIKNLEQEVTDLEAKLLEMKSQREEIEQDAAKLLTCIEEITEQVDEVTEVYQNVKKEVAELVKQENKLKTDKVDVDEKMKTYKNKSDECKGTIHQLEVKISHLKLQEIPNETAVELKKYTKEEIEQANVAQFEKDLEAAENHIKVAKPNLKAIEEYRQKQTVFIERSKELEEISNKRAEMRQLYDNLREKRKEEFMTGYNIIKMKLKEMYQMITLGGDADFEMVDTYDPFTEGIQFNVRPPRKSWKKISNLSGGEKTLSSLALVFALHYYKPSPLYVMDEIDAALDFKNVSIVGHYIKERTKNAQFIIISLRSNMFELCDNLIGIYKVFNCTQTITIDPRAYENPKDQVVPIANATQANSQKVADIDNIEETDAVVLETENTIPSAVNMSVSN